MSWSELSSHCVPAHDAAPPGAAVYLGSGAADDLREGAVLTLFSEGGYDGVRVLVGSDEIGVLTRDAVRDYVASAQQGIGAGDAASLPGLPLASIAMAGTTNFGERWHCPVPGCPQPDIYIVGFDPYDAPTCAVHTQQFLERVG